MPGKREPVISATAVIAIPRTPVVMIRKMLKWKKPNTIPTTTANATGENFLRNQ